MNYIIPLKFRFDASLEYEIPKGLLNFYIELSKEIFKKNLFLPANRTFKAISIEEGDIDIKTNILSEIFSEKLKTEYYEFIAPSNNVTFLIDLSKSNKGSKLLYPLIKDQIIPFLLNNGNNDGQFSQPKFFILLETLYPGEKSFRVKDENGKETVEKLYFPESYYVLLEKFIINGSVCILGFNNNQGLYSWRETSFHQISNFSNKTVKLKKDALELLNYKLIKKVGHFERKFKGAHSACQQFFYTGEYCINEIFELLNEEILNLQKNYSFNPKYIVFQCSLSPWLKESIIRSTNQLQSLKTKNKFNSLNLENCFDLNDFDKNPIENSKINNIECDILFIVDFIHSGSEFKLEYSERVKPYFPNSKVRGLSLLCTDYALKKYKSILDTRNINIHISDEDIYIPVKYFLDVEHKVYIKDDEIDKCPMCRYDLLPRTDNNIDIGLKLSSYEMWLIANSAGYVEEHVRSTLRRNLHWIPDTMKIIEQYGPFLAYKFNQNLKYLFPTYSERPKIIVFPDETTNIYYKKKLGKDTVDLKETPSGFYAKCLEELLNFEIFGIPRELMHAVKGEGQWENNQIRLEDIPEVFPEMFQLIEKLPNNFIIIDEFYSTGKSFELLLAILKISGKTPRCYFPIFNYGRRRLNKKISKGVYKEFGILNLYELNLT